MAMNMDSSYGTPAGGKRKRFPRLNTATPTALPVADPVTEGRMRNPLLSSAVTNDVRFGPLPARSVPVLPLSEVGRGAGVPLPAASGVRRGRRSKLAMFNDQMVAPYAPTVDPRVMEMALRAMAQRGM